MNVIEVRELVRKFGDLTAVDGVSFEVKQGEIFGFLGPNGAGKSTTINMLCTLLRPTSGHATVNGYDVVTQQNAVRESIGLIFQDPSLDDRLTGYENLMFHAMLYDLSRPLFQERAAEVLEMVDLSDKADKLVQTYSGGMRRRLEIARGLLHRPKVMFLDEPTLGLDPQTRRHIWEYITRLRREEDLTIFLTTHYMDEAEICDRIAIIDHGQIIALDTPENLKALVGGDVVAVRTSDNELAARKLRAAFEIEPRPGPDGQLFIEVDHGDQFIPRLMTTLSNSRTPVEVQSINLRRPTLEDVFIKLTGRAIREEEADRARDHMRKRRRMFGGRSPHR
ncbi:MAG TPA: ATP-binding cassette domain-containing protein [Chloroflexi bacterium]|nr:ATP-binding cassette domain-containing protein [Chloroflexota bacterium]